MAEQTKIEWTDATFRRVRPRYNKANLRCVTSTSAGSDHKHPLNEKGHVMAVSTLSFRAYLAQLSGRRLGAFKAAAAKAGLSLDEYAGRIESGLKRCVDCGEWKDRGLFVVDSSRWDGVSAKCRECGHIRAKDAHQIVPAELLARSGPSRACIRPGDSVQARHLVNLDVANGRRPSPNDLHCAKCGHKGDGRRHEYHHHMGYSAEHFFDVVALCSTCHHEEH